MANQSDRFNYYASVQRVMSHVTKNVLSKFAVGATDAEKFEYVWNMETVKRTIKVAPLPQRKSARESRRAREAGNKLFQEQRYTDALEEYNKSVVYAHMPSSDYPDDHDIALALANRSAVLYHLNHCELAMEDMALADSYDYPTNLAYKLEDRRGKCLLKLGQKAKARQAFSSAKALLESSNLNEEKKKIWQEMLAKELDLCEGKDAESNVSKAPSSFTDIQMPQLTDSVSTEFPHASSAFSVDYDRGKGRFAYAKEDLKVGSVLVAEPPVAAVLSNNLYNTHCYHCFKRLFAPVGCFHCSSVRFCNTSCRSASWDSYHKFECKYLQLLNITQVGNIAKLAMKIIMVAGKDKLELCQDMYEIAINTTNLLVNRKKQFVGGVESLYALLTHQNKRQMSELFQYNLLAVFLVKVLEDGGYFKSEIDEFKMFVGGATARLLQVIACNGMEIMETTVPKDVTKCDQESMGLAIYPTISLLNHSCHPTAELVFYGNSCVAHTLRKLRKGEEVSIDYGYVYYSSNKFERQTQLKNQYYFVCNCIACVEDWPTRDQQPSDIPTFKCIECDHEIPSTNLSAQNGVDINAGVTECIRCGKEQASVPALLDSYKQVVMAIPLIILELRQGKVHETIEKLQACVEYMDEHLLLPWKDYVSCFSALRQCYRSMGNRIAA